MPFVFINNVRLAFPDIWEPKSVNNGAPRFGASFPIEPGSENQKKIEAAMVEAATIRWKGQGNAILTNAIRLRNVCFYREPKTDKVGKAYDGFEDRYFINAGANADGRPVLVKRDGKTPVVQTDGLFYSGCRVNAKVEIFAWDNKNGQGVSARLHALQFVADDAPFGGGGPATADGFESLGEEQSDLSALA